MEGAVELEPRRDRRRGHRHSAHPSSHTIPIDYCDRRSVNYLEQHSPTRNDGLASQASALRRQVRFYRLWQLFSRHDVTI